MTTLAAVILNGTYAAMPAAAIDGRIYFATDTFRVYQDNGTIWTDVTPSSLSLPPVALPAPSGASTYALPSAPKFPSASLYFWNGQKMKFGVFYTIAGANLNYLTAKVPQSGDTHELHAS